MYVCVSPRLGFDPRDASCPAGHFNKGSWLSTRTTFGEQVGSGLGGPWRNHWCGLFVKEAYVADRCRSCPHIIKLLDAYAVHEQVHLVYEHGGQDLRRVMEASSPWPIQIRTCMKHVLEGVRHVHSLGLMHGDIKPCNILVEDRGGWFCRLCDVGSVLEVTPGNIMHSIWAYERCTCHKLFFVLSVPATFPDTVRKLATKCINSCLHGELTHISETPRRCRVIPTYMMSYVMLWQISHAWEDPQPFVNILLYMYSTRLSAHGV
jgi:serine/threonine protein kinase